MCGEGKFCGNTGFDIRIGSWIFRFAGCGCLDDDDDSDSSVSVSGVTAATAWYSMSFAGERQPALCQQLMSFYNLGAEWEANHQRVCALVESVQNGSVTLTPAQRLGIYQAEPDQFFRTELMLGIMTKQQVFEFAAGERMEEARDAILALTSYSLNQESRTALETQLLSPYPEVRGAAGYAMFHFGVKRFRGAMDVVIDLARSDPDPGVRALFTVIAQYSL